jgi:hypothetical protein
MHAGDAPEIQTEGGIPPSPSIYWNLGFAQKMEIDPMESAGCGQNIPE